MASLLENIPGVGDLLKRWYAGTGDAGVMFAESAFVTLAGYKIVLPVDISVSSRKRVVVRENEGLRDSIKFITPTVTMDVTLAGRAGNWRKSTLPPIPNIPVVGGAAATVTGAIGTLLGTSELITTVDMVAELFGILRKATEPVQISDEQGLLAAIGVLAVVPLSFDLSPRIPEVSWTMGLLWDLDEDPLTVLFPEEGEEENV